MINIQNQTTNKNMVMDYDGPFLIHSINWGTASTKLTTDTYYGQVGYNVKARKWQARTIKIYGHLIADDTMTLEQRKEYVESLFNLDDDFKITYDSRFIIGATKNTVKWGSKEKESNDQFAKFYIEFYCAYPLFKATQQATYDLSNWTDNLEFDLEIPEDNDTGGRYPKGVEFETLDDNSNKLISLEGHTEVPFTLRFEARGDLTNPKLTNIDTQEFIELLYDLEDGDVVTIDTDQRSASKIILLRDSVEYNLFGDRNKLSNLEMIFSVGSNYVLLEADTGESFLGGSISLYPRYLGVNWEC